MVTATDPFLPVHRIVHLARCQTRGRFPVSLFQRQPAERGSFDNAIVFVIYAIDGQPFSLSSNRFVRD